MLGMGEQIEDDSYLYFISKINAQLRQVCIWEEVITNTFGFEVLLMKPL